MLGCSDKQNSGGNNTFQSKQIIKFIINHSDNDPAEKYEKYGDHLTGLPGLSGRLGKISLRMECLRQDLQGE